jgi:hypothetical protein
VLAAALTVGARRDRLVLLGGLVTVAVLYEAVAAAVFVQNGFGMQGRYILPALIVLVVFAGDALGVAFSSPARSSLARSSPARWEPAVAGTVLALTSLGQLVAWWANSRRYAVGAAGPSWFPPVAAWSPPGGWSAAVAVAGVATVLGLAGAAAAARRPAPPDGAGVGSAA